MTVKSAVNAVVLTVVCNIDRCKHADTISKMLPCFDPCSLCDFLQKWKCCWRKQGFKILRRTVVMSKCSPYICFCIFIIIICVHCRNNLIHYIRFFQLLHIRKVFHMIDTVLFHVFQNFFIYDTFIKMAVLLTGLYCFCHYSYVAPLIYCSNVLFLTDAYP